MSLIIPDLIITNTLNNSLRAIRADYRSNETALTPERSMLYLLFNGLSLGRYMVFENVVEMIITTPEDPRHISEVKLSFDKGARLHPYIIVDCPSETDKNNTMSMGEGNQDELIFSNSGDELDEYRKQLSRRYAATYNIIVGSDNKNEVIILYHLFKSILVFSMNHLIFSGLENPRLGGGNIGFSDRIPDGTFMKAITFNFEYAQVTPEFNIKEIVSKLRIGWSIDDTDPQLQIEIDNE